MIKYFLSLNILSIVLFGCNSNAKQTTANNDSPEIAQHQKDERNKAIALGCIRAFQAQDSEFIISHNADNVVNIVSGRPVYGIDSCRILCRELFNTIKEYKPYKEVALADSDYVFVCLYVDITLRKNPETTHNKSVEIFRFNDEGKIVMHSSVDEQLAPNSTAQSL
ncbi:MAG TPA: nuclear transport factor 2 family protein [Parafilimonas sp.]|nr:nuclear transport factor 2 family protein [Parafilimonas sp.]